MRALASALVSPLGTVIVLWLVALLFEWARAWSTARSLAFLGLCWLVLWSTPTASLALRERLEQDYPPVDPATLPAAQAIVLLGGGVEPPAGVRTDPDFYSSADRVWYAARLYRAGKAPLVVLAGGSDGDRFATSEAEATVRVLRDLGVPESAMLLEPLSRNTAENAERTAELLRGRKVTRVLLVTSALHMARARQEFESRAIEVTPAPTDHEGVPPPGGWRGWLPEAGALHGSARAFRELVARRFVEG